MTTGDQARASVLVRVSPPDAFRIFTEEIDQWWRRGRAYRLAGKRGSVMCLEAGVGGRLLESYQLRGETRVVETGTVTVWEPPTRLVFEWRSVTFAEGERTEVEVEFAPSPSGTIVTVTHRGWAAIRDDHPVRHGAATRAFLADLGRWWGALLSSMRGRTV